MRAAYIEFMRDNQHGTVERVAVPTAQQPIAVPAWWSRLLDGAHPWGSCDAMVSRYGVRRSRLAIYPPGASPTDRRLARLWRGWPISGAALMLLVVMLLGDVAASPDTVLEIAVAAYAGIGALLLLRAGPGRVRVRSMSVILMPGSADVHERHKYFEWQALVEMLTRADQMSTTGTVSSVEYEATWWEAYDRLGATTRV